MTDYIQQLRLERNKTYKKYRKEVNDKPELCQEYFQIYKSLRNQRIQAIRRAKQSYFESFVEDLKDSR